MEKDMKQSGEETADKEDGSCMEDTVQTEAEEIQQEQPEEETSCESDTDQECEGASEAKQEAGSEQKKEKRFWKKEKKDKNAELVEELTDRVKRQMAEFENFRKRSEREKAGMFEMGAKSVIEQLLPIVDNFERGLAAVTEETKDDPFVVGMDKIYQQFTETLDKLEVKPIEAVGKEFNPDIHNAVMHVDDEELGENIVAEEFLKGYTYRGQVVRHSMVKVAN